MPKGPGGGRAFADAGEARATVHGTQNFDMFNLGGKERKGMNDEWMDEWMYGRDEWTRTIIKLIRRQV